MTSLFDGFKSLNGGCWVAGGGEERQVVLDELVEVYFWVADGYFSLKDGMDICDILYEFKSSIIHGRTILTL